MSRTSIYFCLKTSQTKLMVLFISYDTSFLKRQQVVMNGDVESNPGPIAGRPKGTLKKKGFKGTPKRAMNNVDPSLNVSGKTENTQEINNVPKRQKLLPKKLTYDDNLDNDKLSSSFSLSDIIPWSQCSKSNQTTVSSTFNVDDNINEKVSIWEGDITKLKIDAIVNAANETLRGGSGIDGIIHNAAGDDLKKECIKKYPEGCEPGESKVTKAFNLPSKFVIHTVGPRDKDPKKLESCYESCLSQLLDNNIESVAFCCIATGIFHFPHRKAAEIALNTVRNWLEHHHQKVDRIIFCIYKSKEDLDIYNEIMPIYFPKNLDILLTTCDSDVESIVDEVPIKTNVNDVDFFINEASRDSNPIGLINDNISQKENVCFLNATLQVLYNIPEFVDYIRNLQLYHHPLIETLKTLFSLMSMPNQRIRTSNFADTFRFSNYRLGRQFDAVECFEHIISKIYPNRHENLLFKVGKEVIIKCINCGYSPADNNMPEIDIPLDIADRGKAQKISSLISQTKNELLAGYKCDNCNEESCTKDTRIVTLSEVVVVYLKIFRYNALLGISTKVKPKVDIDSQLQLFGNSYELDSIIYHIGSELNSGHYTCSVFRNNKHYLINDHIVEETPCQLTFSSRERMNPYVVVYRKKNNSNIRSSITIPGRMNKQPILIDVDENISLDDSGIGTQSIVSDDVFNEASTSSTVPLNMKCPEEMNKQSLLKELGMQNNKLKIIDDKNAQKEKNVKTPVKRKSKFKVNDSANRMKKFRETLDEQAKKDYDDAHRDQVENYRKKQKSDPETKKDYDDANRESSNKYVKNKTSDPQGKNDYDDDNRANVKKFRVNTKTARQEAFDEVSECSMVDPAILESTAFKCIEEDFRNAIQKGPDYICNICHKCEWRDNVLHFRRSNYDEEILEKCDTGKSNWICKTCDKSMKKDKMPIAAHNNGLGHCPDIKELEDLCPLEIMLISQIIPYMFIVAKTKGAQNGLKGQCVLVPADLRKVQTELPRNCNDELLISLALKRRLTDKSAYHKQHIRPALVNRALAKLQEINPFYRDVVIDGTWENVSEENDPTLWNLLTNENIIENSEGEETDSDEEIEGNNQKKEKEQHLTNTHPTVMHNVDGPNIDPSQVINIAPAEGQIPVSHINEPDCEALAFPKHFSTGQFHFNYKRERPITVLKYIHSRLKNCNMKYAEDPQYLFYCLDWHEKEVVSSTKQFVLRKQFQSNVNVGQLTNTDNVRNMIHDDQLYASFKNVRGTPQYFHNMLLDVLAKVRQFGSPTFFLTWSAAEFKWPEVIQVVARQYGETLSVEEIENMSWNDKLKYLQRNPVLVARQIDYIFKQMWGKVILGGMHPIGQILDFEEKREFQSRGNEHPHASVHVENAPKIIEDDDSNDNNVIDFIDRYITCSLPDEEQYPELSSLVKEVQTHHHTTSCRKKKGVTCKFNAPWPPSENTMIIRGDQDLDKQLVQESRKTLDKVLLQITQIDNLSDVSVSEILDMCDITEEQYYEALKNMQKKLCIVYKRKPSEVNIGPYNTVVLSILKANMNIQYVTGIYGMLMYLTSYLCKPERSMSELMKKAAKEASGKEVMQKLHAIGNIFLTKREVSSHEAVKRTLSLHLRGSKISTLFVPTGLKSKRTRLLKPNEILKQMDPDDTNVYAANIIDRYENRPDQLNEMCYADFAANYIPESADVVYEPDDIRSYTKPVSNVCEEEQDLKGKKQTIKLKNDFGKMRKRQRPVVIRFHTVSKLKNPEEHYLRLLQLYMPWRDENLLKDSTQSYEEKYIEVEDEIEENIRKHEPFVAIDYDELQNFPDIDESDSEDDSGAFNMINPDMIDFDNSSNINSNVDTSHAPSASVDDYLLPREEFYSMCSQSNDEQKHFLDFIMTYIMKSKTAFKNNLDEPDPFYIHLTGGAGVGKSFLTNVFTEYVKRKLKYHGQGLDQPSILVTGSTGKAAAQVNGVTLHSAFNLQIKRKKGYVPFRGLSKVNLQAFWNKYKYLKILVIDEISMTDYYTFNEYLNSTLKLIKNNKLPFGGVSIIAAGDFLQLPPVGGYFVFQTPNHEGYSCLAGNPWHQLFLIYELTKIVRQVDDPEFAQMLNRIREEKHTDDDARKLEALADTDTSNWPKGFVKIYITNRMANEENERCIKELGTKVYTINAKDSSRDLETNALVISLTDKPVHVTGNLQARLKLCVGARVMLSVNLDLNDKLCNGSIGEIKYIQVPVVGNTLLGKVYVKFDDPDAGKSRKDNRLRGELKECVPIEAKAIDFFYYHNNSRVSVTRKQFPFKLGHGITIHNGQGSTMVYVEGNFDRTSQNGKPNSVHVNHGAVYSLTSRVKSKNNLKLTNFKADYIKASPAALEEIDRMRREASFTWCHPLQNISGTKVILCNIRSWNLHIQHFMNDAVFSTNCDLMCFTETRTNSGEFNRIEQYVEGWKDIHDTKQHGVSLCYKEESVTIIRDLQIPGVLEILVTLIEVKGERILIVLVYRAPTAPTMSTFINGLIRIVTENLQDGDRLIILGDFNMDQMLPENVEKCRPLMELFCLHQRSQYSTHESGGILDLVFDTQMSQSVSWVPSPYSDHFIICFEL